jgi:hypothetical protein
MACGSEGNTGADDAYERKANFEEMGYLLPPKKTEYPYWVDGIGE